MKKKTIGILVVMLLMATIVLPVVGSMNVENNINEEKNISEENDKIIRTPTLIDTLRQILHRQTQKYINQDQDWLPDGAGNNAPIYHMGNVGIGTANPLNRLYVDGTVRVTDGIGIFGANPDAHYAFSSGGDLKITNVQYTNDWLEIGSREGTAQLIFLHVGGAIGAVHINSAGQLSTESLQSWYGYTNEWGDILIKQGKINIGMTSYPTYALEVNDYSGGDILAQFNGRVKGPEAVNDDEFITMAQVDSRIKAYYTPSGTNDPSGDIGDFAWDADYLYVETDNGWKRTAFETWEGSSSLTE